MRTGTTQFFYCCGVNFARQFKLVSKSIKKQGGTILTFTEEPDAKPSSWDLKKWGFHTKCIKGPGSTRRLAHDTNKNIMRCTITYEV